MEPKQEIEAGIEFQMKKKNDMGGALDRHDGKIRQKDRRKRWAWGASKTRDKIKSYESLDDRMRVRRASLL